jgi:hypothetical protein
LFYIAADQKLMAVPVKTGANVYAGAPQSLFEIQLAANPVVRRFPYQPTRDGQRFLALVPASGEAPAPISVVLNWQEGLRK